MGHLSGLATTVRTNQYWASGTSTKVKACAGCSAGAQLCQEGVHGVSDPPRARDPHTRGQCLLHGACSAGGCHQGGPGCRCAHMPPACLQLRQSGQLLHVCRMPGLCLQIAHMSAKCPTLVCRVPAWPKSASMSAVCPTLVLCCMAQGCRWGG